MPEMFARLRRPMAAALGVCAAAAVLSAAPPPQRPPTFRGGVELVTLAVTVLDRDGTPVTGFTAGDFTVVEDGRPQRIQSFAAGDGGGSAPPLHLGLLIDASESMGDDLRFTHTAAVKFVNTLTDAVDVTIVSFDAEVRVARYPQREFRRLIERIRSQKAGGLTALYDAIGVYLDGAADQDGRKVMLLYTDGGDTTSAMDFGDLLDLLKASDVTVYAIGELDRQAGSIRGLQRSVLQRIAEITGGQVFFPRSVRDLDRVYEQVVAGIRAQYTLGYVSTNTAADGAWRRVEVKAAKDGRTYRVRARKGYFAPLRN